MFENDECSTMADESSTMRPSPTEEIDPVTGLLVPARFSGWLLKKSPSKLRQCVAAMQRRYVVIHKGILYYGTMEDEVVEDLGHNGTLGCKGQIDLVQNPCKVSPSRNQTFILRPLADKWISGSFTDWENGREFVFDADHFLAQHDKQEWMKALNAHIQYGHAYREYKAHEAVIRADDPDFESRCAEVESDELYDSSPTRRETKLPLSSTTTETKYEATPCDQPTNQAMSSDCTIRWPVPGEAVQRLDGQAINLKDQNGQKDAWHLAPDGTAWVVDVDATGDFKLRNQEGIISSWTFRKKYRYVDSAGPFVPCKDRRPAPNDAVRRIDGAQVISKDCNGKVGAWSLLAGEVAWVHEVDADCDFKLRNASGVISALAFRWRYRYVT